MMKFKKMKMNAITLYLYVIYLNNELIAPGPGTTPRSAAAAAAATTASRLFLIFTTILATARFTTTGIFATSAAD